MKNEMKTYLRFLAKYHTDFGIEPCLPELLLKQGLWFKGRVDSDEYAPTKQWKQFRRPKAQDCFFNAQDCCVQDNGSRYFEGYVLVRKGIEPSEHCWVVMEDGQVVDFTLEAAEVIVAEKGITADLRAAVYVGLEVPREFIAETVAKTEWHGPLAEEFYVDQIRQIAFSRR